MAGVAQLEERFTCNEDVTGSTPVTGSNNHFHIWRSKMDFEALVATMVILLSSGFDALRDGWMRSEGWWKRHSVKWVSFYLPLMYITMLSIHWHYWLPLCVMSWIVWRLCITKIAGKQWESMWSRWLKEISWRIWHK